MKEQRTEEEDCTDKETEDRWRKTDQMEEDRRDGGWRDGGREDSWRKIAQLEEERADGRREWAVEQEYEYCLFLCHITQ